MSTDITEVSSSESFAPQSGFLSDEFRLLDRYELQSELVETLKHTAHNRKLVPKLAACHRSFRHWRCQYNHDWAEAENSCSIRVCPHCSRRRALILAGRVENFVMGKAGLRYVVLSEQNSDNLKKGIASLWASWTRLRRSVCWKRHVIGCIVALEVTRNPQDGTWHPHLNVLLEGDYFPFEELNQAWITCTKRRGQTSFIRAADAGTVRELIKYVTKTAELVSDPEALDEFLEAVKSMRLIRTYGTFFRMPVDDEANPGTCCPDCQKNGIDNSAVVKLGYVAPQQVSLDFDGVLRVARPPTSVESDMREALSFPPAVPPAPSFRRPSALLRLWDEVHKRLRQPAA